MELWKQIVNMVSSKAPLFVVSGVAITEQQFLLFIGIIVLILFIFLIRNVLLLKTLKREVIKTDDQPDTTEEKEKEKPDENLLKDTSEKRRTLYDFVLPDTIHTDVVKQTLNNDYPYLTLKPDSAKIQTAKSETTPLANIEFANVPKTAPEVAPTIQPAPVVSQTTNVLPPLPTPVSQVVITTPPVQQQAPIVQPPVAPITTTPQAPLINLQKASSTSMTTLPPVNQQQTQPVQHFNPADSLIP